VKKPMIYEGLNPLQRYQALNDVAEALKLGRIETNNTEFLIYDVCDALLERAEQIKVWDEEEQESD
jgi:hypothetical protein